MENFAFILDKSLIVLVGFTLALIVWKILDLWLPACFKTSWEKRFGSTSDKLECCVEQLEEGLTLLSVIATTAPFVGLVGTIMHIMQALKSLNGAGADMSLISGPIAVALNTTLIGLAASIPAFIAYNLFQRRIQLLENRQRRHLASFVPESE